MTVLADAVRAPVRRVFRWTLGAVVTLALVVVTVVLVRAFDARQRDPLEPWHRLVPRDVRAEELEGLTFAQYVAREREVFADLRRDLAADAPGPALGAINRYVPGGPLDSSTHREDWNLTVAGGPPVPMAGALLVHGLTDSPYSMRHLARALQASGYYTVALRMPGHGTVPGGLVGATWEDWAAAVRLGARHVRQHVGDKPLVVVGYSNGGALAVHYALSALDRDDLPRPSRLVLLSPMIGVTPFAGLANVLGVLGRFPYFEQSRWLDILPEYNPYKYNSFPTNAGQQTARLTGELQRQITRIAGAGRLAQLPPILTFQSAVDSTVSTEAIITRLYDRLDGRSELVLFDINRQALVRPFLRPSQQAVLVRLFGTAAPRPFRITLVTNASPETRAVVARSRVPGGTEVEERPLAAEWPAGIFSLSHVAIPFPVHDGLYGTEPAASDDAGVRLGILGPRGERGVLAVPVDQLMRLGCNPFYPYLEERLVEWARAAN